MSRLTGTEEGSGGAAEEPHLDDIPELAFLLWQNESRIYARASIML